MSTFDENSIVRDAAGKFDEKHQSAPEVTLGARVVLPSALDSARERLRLAKRALEDEVAREARRVGATIPDAHRLVFEERDAEDGDGNYLHFSHAQDADGEIVAVTQVQHNALLDLGLELDPRSAECFDGGDAELNWLNVHDENVDPVAEAEAAVDRAVARLHAAAPGSAHWEAADKEVQESSVAAVRAITPEGISKLLFDHGEFGVDLVGAVAVDGSEVDPTGLESYDDINWYGSNIANPYVYIGHLGEHTEGQFSLSVRE